jgi:hypothetical protein
VQSTVKSAVDSWQCSRQLAVKMMTDSKELLHKLNNQLGVILAHAELLETKAQDASQKARASQVVNAALQAMAVSRELRETVGEK